MSIFALWPVIFWESVRVFFEYDVFWKSIFVVFYEIVFSVIRLENANLIFIINLQVYANFRIPKSR